VAYEQHVRDAVLKRCGVTGMHTAGNTLAERAPGEMIYYGVGGQNPYDMSPATSSTARPSRKLRPAVLSASISRITCARNSASPPQAISSAVQRPAFASYSPTRHPRTLSSSLANRIARQEP
jgi:hypothetical protein